MTEPLLPQPPHKPVLSRSYSDVLIPGVVVELDPLDAEMLGAFRETALDPDEAWDANDDVEAPEHGA